MLILLSILFPSVLWNSQNWNANHLTCNKTIYLHCYCLEIHATSPEVYLLDMHLSEYGLPINH